MGISSSASNVFVLALCIIVRASAGSTSYPPPHDYDYSATQLIYETYDLVDRSFVITPGFSFRMNKEIYTSCWFHTDGGLSFDMPDNRSYYEDYTTTNP